MPPKISFTKEDFYTAGIKIIKQNGSEGINARSLAEAVKGSTQPVYSLFGNIDNFKEDLINRIYKIALESMLGFPDSHDKFLSIGMGYIAFALNEPRLYSFVFQENSRYITRIKDDLRAPLLERMKEEPHLKSFDDKNRKRILDYMTIFSQGLIIDLQGRPRDEAMDEAWQKMKELGFTLIAFEIMRKKDVEIKEFCQ